MLCEAALAIKTIIMRCCAENICQQHETQFLVFSCFSPSPHFCFHLGAWNKIHNPMSKYSIQLPVGGPGPGHAGGPTFSLRWDTPPAVHGWSRCRYTGFSNAEIYRILHRQRLAETVRDGLPELPLAGISPAKILISRWCPAYAYMQIWAFPLYERYGRKKGREIRIFAGGYPCQGSRANRLLLFPAQHSADQESGRYLR